ncbi:MAG: undecaprenyl-diphosphatase, partial [Deltaproteobacteria bacterium]
MGLFHAVFLGIIQGLTEFLPISSSGHLVLFQYLFGIKEPEIFFDVAVHMGT